MLDAVETKLDENRWRIDGAIANLDFIIEYCEANNTTLKYMRPGSLESSLKSVVRELKQIQESIEEARDKHVVIRGDISDFTLKTEDDSQVVSSDKLVDMYLTILDNIDSLDDKIRQRDEVISQMRKNRLARKNRISVVNNDNVSTINHE